MTATRDCNCASCCFRFRATSYGQKRTFSLMPPRVARSFVLSCASTPDDLLTVTSAVPNDDDGRSSSLNKIFEKIFDHVPKPCFVIFSVLKKRELNTQCAKDSALSARKMPHHRRDAIRIDAADVNLLGEVSVIDPSSTLACKPSSCARCAFAGSTAARNR